LGPSSPNTQFPFQQIETYGGAVARMPLLNWLDIEGQIENRKPIITFSRAALASNAITEGTAPGLSHQPDFMHYGAGLRIRAQAISEPVTNDPAVTPAGTPEPPLLKHKLVFNFNNEAQEHWFAAQNDDRFSFRQFIV